MDESLGLRVLCRRHVIVSTFDLEDIQQVILGPFGAKLGCSSKTVYDTVKRTKIVHVISTLVLLNSNISRLITLLGSFGGLSSILIQP